MNGLFWVDNQLQMSQNNMLLNLTTKSAKKQCKYNSKTVARLSFLIIHAPEHDEKTDRYLLK